MTLTPPTFFYHYMGDSVSKANILLPIATTRSHDNQCKNNYHDTDKEKHCLYEGGKMEEPQPCIPQKKDVLLRYNGNIVSLKAVCLSVCLAA